MITDWHSGLSHIWLRAHFWQLSWVCAPRTTSCIIFILMLSPCLCSDPSLRLFPSLLFNDLCSYIKFWLTFPHKFPSFSVYPLWICAIPTDLQHLLPTLLCSMVCRWDRQQVTGVCICTICTHTWHFISFHLWHDYLLPKGNTHFLKVDRLQSSLSYQASSTDILYSD